MVNNYMKAFSEGEDVGRAARSLHVSPLSITELEPMARAAFRRNRLTFEEGVDGVQNFIAGYWHGWRAAAK
jgi:hypothetical protein